MLDRVACEEWTVLFYLFIMIVNVCCRDWRALAGNTQHLPIATAIAVPEDVHGRSIARVHLHQVQQVLQDVEQLLEAQMRTAPVQVLTLSVRSLQGVHTPGASG
ncbi:hypothetical protein KQX54_003957 [Cotesia glomerata]|uniref:Secreted protein n=1 Tax=Cotesia glomerata TaxID=32391 RepID=A0AAV7IKS9_COTGL|nr:hypothetical protein KQX54_003957 [Cotesia glomerata]